MKIVKLVAENVKRLHAVTIEPDGALVTVGGKNGAGKSSVLDAIAYALGGEKLVPSEPIRTGESEAKIVVDLGDLVVTRKFTRKRLVYDAPPDAPPTMTDAWGPTTSTLTVTNKDGARYPSPQAVLDRLLGKLTFDPLTFARMSETSDGRKQQDETLRKLVGLDVAPIEQRRAAAAAQRAMLKKTHAIKEAQLLALPTHKDAPDVEQPLTTGNLKQAEEYRRLAEEAERGVEKVQSIINEWNTKRNEVGVRIEEIQKHIKSLEREVEGLYTITGNIDVKLEGEHKALDAAQITAQAARAVVPDMEEISAEMSAIEATNAKVRANQQHAALKREVDDLGTAVATEDAAVKRAEKEKADLLANATFPVDGLGLAENGGVIFNGLPFEQAGSAEQVRVSVAIGVALNPTLKVLLIRNGNLLDGDSLKAVTAQAEVASMQVWMEVVTESKDGVAVMLVDGEVV